jgi:hypothetical protein
MNNIQRIEFLFEDMNGKFDFLVEAISILQKDVAEMRPKVDCIPSMLEDIRGIKLISREHSMRLNNQEGRIIKLEAI